MTGGQVETGGHAVRLTSRERYFRYQGSKEHK